MGQRGPTRLPTAVKVLHGERRPGRLNHEAPRPRDGRPVMPSDMSPDAQKVWRRTMREMADANVIKAVDADALRIYCEAVARYQEAARALAESTPLVRGARGGSPTRNPLHQIVRDNAVLVRLYARELGLTPAARENLHGGEQEQPADEFDAWAAGSAG